MNFLSHYYFDQQAHDSNFVLGLVLPDLTKNFNKTWNIHPHKFHDKLSADQSLLSIYKGWQKHLMVDKYFHSSTFFKNETDKVKEVITPLLVGTQVRPFILAHIGLELILDSLLIETQKIDVAKFYTHLKQADRSILLNYLSINNILEPATFFSFYDKFVENQYLFSYTDYQKLVYALNRICYGVWGTHFTEETKEELQQVLTTYKDTLIDHFMKIFDEIESKI
ncbi:hypothetical protein [Solitalea canadensis]|uniref:Acyl carrier protein phosphodiesterase n=1 Tax=Solitalea canadensis (strain ATCC 29591 / DSM 3403 / JCM 21819 / LMG 8368 / NBRC 15130 / NCIMB 12057 / USAM 9D) TaxID=929556 RepID=H8KRW8_SOLCM|nr:hypothetical protein [Solitalea canadensis]AFD07756.1 hypothetical protein Solca_2723 [Solitalea canadensis DSM 3403]